jgi:hypothetical protein
MNSRMPLGSLVLFVLDLLQHSGGFWAELAADVPALAACWLTEAPIGEPFLLTH